MLSPNPFDGDLLLMECNGRRGNVFVPLCFVIGFGYVVLASLCRPSIEATNLVALRYSRRASRVAPVARVSHVKPGSDSIGLTSTHLDKLTRESVRPLVELNDRINSLTSREESINAPRIVVIGDQSHGKSSVIEALGAVDLPRGDDIKTRVPLILQLRNGEVGDEHALISGEGMEAKRINSTDVAEHVENLTAEIAGSAKGVKDEAIDLKVFRPDQDDLTLIDLPGITRVAREGQTSDGKQLELMILEMCRKYCSPRQTVILNVVSAMVDFSTSASLQLSQELDPHGHRTLLCVTKIDQHTEPGLAKKLQDAIKSMHLRPDHTFVVRNRKQEENDQFLSLARARELETKYIESNDELRLGAESAGYGLGVEALSKRLVCIQLERIVETLPATAKAIQTQLEGLQHRLVEIGLPLCDELECKLTASKLVDRCHEVFVKEREGRSARAAGAWKGESETFELEVEIPDVGEARRQKEPTVLTSAVAELLGDLKVQLEVCPLKEGSKGMSAYVRVINLPKEIQSVSLELTVTLENKGIIERSRSASPPRDLSAGMGLGWDEFVSGAAASLLTGKCVFRASAYVSSFVAANSSVCNRLFCALLNDLEDDFHKELERTYPGRIFFSREFGFKLKADARHRRGSIGMPGSTSPDVPLNVLRELRKKLPAIVDGHVRAVSSTADDKLKSIIYTCVDSDAHPNLAKLLVSTSTELIARRTKTVQAQVLHLLQYEDSEAHTSNHYYMDIVQDLRREILDDRTAEEVWKKRPGFLKGLDFSSLKKQSNEEQELVDLQIKIFAYWKMMMKRFVDYVEMAVRFHLSAQLAEELKPLFFEAIANAGDPKQLLACDESIEAERLQLTKRIEDLKKASELLGEAERQQLTQRLGDHVVDGAATH